MATRTEHSSLRQGLVGAWCPSLGASGLLLIDYSGRNSHGPLTNMDGQDNWRASGSGLALNFDGTNDIVTPPDRTRLAGNAAFSVCAWIKTASDGTITDAGNNIGTLPCLVRTTSTGGMSFSGGGPIIQKTGVYSVNVWSHVALVYPGTVIRDVVFFGGGVDLGTGTEGGGAGAGNIANNYSAASTLRIGSRTNSTAFFNGQMDDLRVYSRALTPAEIRLLASRRGIGLTPLPDRAAGLPRRWSVNVGGTWREADAYVRTPTDWRLSDPKINVGGVWK